MEQTEHRVKNFVVDILYDVVGSILFSIGIYTFAKSANFAPGGVSGLALIFNHLWGLPIGVMSLVLNIPIIFICYKVVGKKFLFKSLRTMVFTTLLIDVILPFTPMYHGDRFLASLFTGVFVGAGMAIIYKRGSSTGGADFLIVAINKMRPHLSLGTITLLIDIVVIGLGGFVFADIDAMLYGIICTFAASTVIDKLMYGVDGGKLAMIITTNGMQVAKRIDQEIDRGSTLVRAVGTYSGTERDMLLCVCAKEQMVKAKSAVHDVDPEAFIMVTDAAEVFGEGFKERANEK